MFTLRCCKLNFRILDSWPYQSLVSSSLGVQSTMIKLVLMVTLMGVLVRPSHSGNCCSSLLNSAKAAAGNVSRLDDDPPLQLASLLDTALFTADVVTDVVNGLNLYWGPSNATINETEGVNATGIGDDIALFATDVVTDVFNKLNLRPGNATIDDDDDTERIKYGGIKKAHPILGITMMAIPFIPMTIACPMLAVSVSVEACGGTCGGTCITIVAVLFSILLALPFSALATPAYILLVFGMGIYGIIRPTEFKPGDELKKYHGLLKTAEISVESAIQTCLGKKSILPQF